MKGDKRDIANALLERLEIIDPNCIIAGGAPRDWFLGKQPNDLDFYYHIPEGICWGNARRQLEKLFDVPFKELGEGVDHTIYDGMEGLQAVYEAEIQGVTCQFMRMKHPTFRGTVEDFCCSLSKIWYKGGQVRHTAQFLGTLALGVVVYKGYIETDNKYYLKMVERFPQFNHFIEPKEEEDEGWV